MQAPKFLSQNDTVGIISTARFITRHELQPSLDFLQQLGLNVVLGNHLFQKDNQFAGSDKDRASDLQMMLDNPNINAIWCARGGYGSVRIVDQLDYTKFIKNPKWIIGYSDVTVFHNHLNQVFQLPTIHGTMPISIEANTSPTLEAFESTIFGQRNQYAITSTIEREGKAKGEIVGGNLSIIYSLLGSNSQLDTAGKILFIEDIDEMLYHLDRMMVALKRAGMLNNLQGLIVGGMTDMRDNTKAYGFSFDNPYGRTAKEIIWEHVHEYKFPVCFDFPAGHQRENYPILMGVDSSINFTKNELLIEHHIPSK